MLDFFITSSKTKPEERQVAPRFSLGGPIYWFLHRYFVQADLNPGDYSFLNLYEDTELSGYQLHRLQTELNEALTDLSSRPISFSVLTGWVGETKSVDTEDWAVVHSDEVKQAIHKLLSLISEAQENKFILLAVGD